MQKQRNNRANLMNRRQMLRMMGVTGVGLAMAGCLPPPSATSTGDAGQAAASSMDLSKWRLGSVDPNWDGTFTALSWEDEGEFRKWNYHIDNFFKSNYPKAKTEINWGVPWGEYWTKLPTAITGGDPPDLAWMHDTRVQAFSSRDLFIPLDDYIAANKPIDWPDAFYKTQVDAFKYDGKQYAIPYDWAPGGLYVNKTLIEGAGFKMPTEATTFDEFLEMAKAVSKPDENIFGINLPYGWPAGLYWVYRSFGADFFAPDLTKGAFDSDQFIEATQWLADLRFKHNVAVRPENLQGINNPFSQGVVAMNFSLNDEAFKQGDLIAGSFEWDVAPTPTGPNGRFQFVGGSGWSIPKGAKNPDLAWELMRYVLSDPEALPITAKMGSSFVSRADMWEHAFDGAEEVGFTKEAYKHTFYDLGQANGVVPPYHPKYVEWESLWQKHMDPVFIGENSDVAAACKALNDDTNKLLAG